MNRAEIGDTLDAPDALKNGPNNRKQDSGQNADNSPYLKPLDKSKNCAACNTAQPNFPRIPGNSK